MGAALPKTAAGDRQLSEVMRSPSFYLLCAGVVAPPFIVTTIFFHQIYLSNLRGWPVELFASGFVLMSAATAACALTCGWLIDRYTAVRVLPFFLLPLTFACFVISLVVSPVAVFIFMGLVGISNGFAATLFGALGRNSTVCAISARFGPSSCRCWCSAARSAPVSPAF